MKNEIRAVELTRAIRDQIYEETKDLSEEELIRYFKTKSGTLGERRGVVERQTELAPGKGRRSS